ncbi:MAG: TRAM domain-containing protein [Christensenellales bacterium]
MMREIPIEKNDDIEFTIDALGSEGQGIGRVDGYTVFVPLALPGEKIRAHVIKTTSGYGVAKLTEVMEPSKDRAQQDCPAYPRCGGCSMRHMSYAAQLAAKTKAGGTHLSVSAGLMEANKCTALSRHGTPIGIATRAASIWL